MFILKIIIIVPFLFVISLYGNNDSASFYVTKGIELYNSGNMEISEKYFKKAISVAKDKKYINEALSYIGWISMKMGKYDNAINYLLSIDTAYIEQASIYNNLAAVYKKMGDSEKSLYYCKEALKYTTTPANIAVIYNNMAIIFYKLNKIEIALEYYKKSLELKLIHNPNSVSYSYLNIALCYGQLDSIKLANIHFKKTINERVRLYGEDHYRLITAYLNYGEFLLLSHPEKAKTFFHNAYNIAISTYGDKHPETANSLAAIGRYYFYKKDYITALEYYQKALIANSKGFDNTDLSFNPIPSKTIAELKQLVFLKDKADILAQYAKTFENNRDVLHNSIKTYEAAIDLLFYIQNSFMDGSKRQLIANNKDIFYKAADAALKFGDKIRAYKFIEQGKASTLLSELSNQDAIQFGDIPETLAGKENELKRKLFFYKAQENSDSVLFFQQKYDSLVVALEKNYPKYYSLKYEQRGFNPKQYLDTNQVLLQYAVTDSCITTFIVTTSSIGTSKLKTDSMFYSMVNKFLNCLRNYDVNSRYKEQYMDYTESAYYLFTKLMLPLNIPLNKSLIIVPDGILSYIPFEAFLYKKPVNDENYFNFAYLLYHHPVSYAYSTRWLFDDYTGNPEKNVGSFAMDYLDKDSLTAIFYGIPEAKKIRKKFGGENFFNKNCTSHNFIENAEKYNILFLSLHGIINNNDGMLSYLPLYDRDLYTWEIYGMKLNARLAYLSACNTGDGKIDEGEGIMSMARAFAYAGCPTLISSLAGEYDNTPELTEVLFSMIKEGESVDFALQQAKIKHIQGLHKAHPRFWANKIVMGKTTPIKNQRNYLWVLVSGGIFLLFIFLRLFVQFFKKTNHL